MLHVWVDWINFPFGRVILRGVAAGCLLATVEPSTNKWPVAPESEMAYFTTLHTFGLSILVAVIGSSCNFFSWTRLSHADALVCIAGEDTCTLCRMGATAVAWRLLFLWGSDPPLPKKSYLGTPLHLSTCLLLQWHHLLPLLCWIP